METVVRHPTVTNKELLAKFTLW